MQKKQCPESREQIIISAVVDASLLDGLQIGLIEEEWHGYAAIQKRKYIQGGKSVFVKGVVS
jgi:hypothetical protein